MSYAEDNKRLAKNTLFLYFRTAVVMLISLYISRVVLDVLGVEDYGVYNVVGSIVVLFSFLNSAMTQASQRFITFEKGKKENAQIQKVFSMSLNTQSIIVIAIILLAETLGLWFLNNRLNLPSGRLIAANWVYQFSILTFCINVLRVPYEGTVIAYEKMSFFAYASIIDAVLKLLGVYLLKVILLDKLISYSAIIFFISILMFFAYKAYCNLKFRSSRYIFDWDVTLFKKLLTYSSWSMFGSFSNVATQSGFIFLINIFYGVVANAAMGIANQVSNAMSSIVSGFQTSARPQIVKAYSQGESIRFFDLITRTSKFSFSLIFIPALILIVNMPLILSIWLKEVPEYAVSFAQLLVISVVFDATSGPYNIAIMSSERIRNYQLTISSVFLLDLIVSYLLIRLGVLPSYVLISRILTRGVINLFVGLFYLNSLFKFNVIKYMKSVLLPIFIVVTFLVPIVVYLINNSSGWFLFAYSIISLLVAGSLLAYFVIFDKNEKKYILNFIKNRI
ncbi:MAG: lipopolysaccharide biosynthesis protein [Tissierellia bacterium]|nr:lipopolysaccharide biosynthesis protein [Tissierellia bacterium]